MAALPKLRTPSTRRDAHTSLGAPPVPSPEAMKALRRNARKEERAKERAKEQGERAEWRHKPRGFRPGIAGLLDAIQGAA